MANNAFIYRRPSKWPIATALAAAVLIHLSAVAIAFHQGSPATPPTATESTTFGIYFATSRRLLQIPVFLSRRPYRFPQPISSNLRELVA
jgi:CHASE2 domain-containing sensor protein